MSAPVLGGSQNKGERSSSNDGLLDSSSASMVCAAQSHLDIDGKSE